jgi:putative Mg2+ transporter-C (MgtC) family protein
LIEANMEELLRTTTFSAGELSLRLAVAGLCGIVLGVDREIRGFAAGIRTHALISLSSALITISALMLYQEIGESGHGNADPFRVIQGLVQAVGIIGAGAIFIARGSVKNLTTAANIWLSAAVGTAAERGRPHGRRLASPPLTTGPGECTETVQWAQKNAPLHHPPLSRPARPRSAAGLSLFTVTGQSNQSVIMRIGITRHCRSRVSYFLTESKVRANTTRRALALFERRFHAGVRRLVCFCALL